MTDRPHPVSIRSPHGATSTNVEWSDGTSSTFEHVALRAFCPCAGCQGHSGTIRWVEGTENMSKRNLELREIEPVGNYAVNLTWGDGHSSGIYTFAYLAQLAVLAGKSLEEQRAFRPRG